jgi:hypothetical protein
VNATHARRLSDATLPAAILRSPIDIFLVEFSINGIEYVDVLLRRLRAKYPAALIIYVDHFRLLDWREWVPPAQPPLPPAGSVRNVATARAVAPPFRLRDDFRTAPECTPLMDRWLTGVHAGVVSLRRELGAQLPRYHDWLPLFAGDKYHLTARGHEALARSLFGMVERTLNEARERPRLHHCAQGCCEEGASPSTELDRHEQRAHSGKHGHFEQHQREAEVQCFYWYRTGKVDPRLRVEAGRGWAMAQGVSRSVSHGEGNGKFAFELTDPERHWRHAQLVLRLRTTAARSRVRVGFMLHCCMYGEARVSLDGRPAALINGSVPSFPHHVMQVATVGTFALPGNHTISVQVVGAGVNGSHQFRLAWVHVAESLSGLQADSEYKLTERPPFRLLPSPEEPEGPQGEA